MTHSERLVCLTHEVLTEGSTEKSLTAAAGAAPKASEGRHNPALLTSTVIVREKARHAAGDGDRA